MSKSAGNVREFPYANNAVDIHSHVNKPGDHVEKIFSMGVPSMPSVEEIQRRIQELMKMQQVDPGAFIVDHTGPKTTFPWGGITPPDFVPVGPGVLPQPISPVPSIPEVSKHDISELKKSLQEEIRGLTDKWKRDETLLTEHVDILSKKLKESYAREEALASKLAELEKKLERSVALNEKLQEQNIRMSSIIIERLGGTDGKGTG